MRKIILLLGLVLLCGCSESRSTSSSSIEERREVIIDSETTLLPNPQNC